MIVLLLISLFCTFLPAPAFLPHPLSTIRNPQTLQPCSFQLHHQKRHEKIVFKWRQEQLSQRTNSTTTAAVGHKHKYMYVICSTYI